MTARRAGRCFCDAALVFGAGVLTALLIALGTRVAIAGDTNLDPAFGDGGFVLSGTWRAWVTDLAVLPDGRVVAVGGDYGDDPGGMLWQYDQTGTPDPTFGTSGSVVLGATPSAYGNVHPIALRAVARADDGKLVVVADGAVLGLPYYESDPLSLIYRLEPNGTLDSTFGNNGLVVINLLPSGTGPTPRSEGLSGVAIQADGRIVAVGECAALACDPFGAMIVRLLPDGTLDTSFAGDGILNTAVADTRVASIVAPLSDGRVLVAGWRAVGAHEGVMFRLLEDGTLDPTFGEFHDGCHYATFPGVDACTGYAVTSSELSSFAAMALDSTGRMIFTGGAPYTSDTAPADIVVQRYQSDGTLDATFGSGGTAHQVLSGEVEFHPADVGLTPAGRILVAGMTQVQRLDNPGVGLLRWNDDGSTDAGFGSGGFARVDLEGGYTRPYALAIQPDGARTLVAGQYSYADARFMELAFVARLGGLCGNGTLDPGEQCDDGNSLGFDCCSSGCRHDAPGSGCDNDGRLCTFDTCDGAGACVAGGAAPTCRAVTVADGSQLKIARRLGRDAFRWKWLHGQATDTDEFGFPADFTRFTMCFYEAGNLTGEIALPVGAGWRYLPDDFSPRGLLYRGDSTPIRRVRMSAGLDGEAGIRVQGKGVGIGLPSLPASTPLTLRLLNDRRECWGAQYDSPTVNSENRFSATGE